MVEHMTLTTRVLLVPTLKLSSFYDSVQAICPASRETDKHFYHDSAYSKERVVCVEL